MIEPKGFPQFWAAYPRKTAKGAAVHAWTKLRLDRNPFLLGTILGALEWQREQAKWTEQDGRFIPYPATWLNRWQWEDERPKAAVSYAMDCPHTPRCAGRNDCHVKQQIQQAMAS